MSLAAAGAVLSTSDGGSSADNGGDLCADPYAVCSHVTTSAGPASAYYEAIFPAAAGFPGGLPVPVGYAYYINNVAGSPSRRQTTTATSTAWTSR